MMKLNRDIRITWVGHATFHLTTPEGVGILIDPWITSNPACPAALKPRVRDRLAAILLTHGHFDHLADLVELAQEYFASVYSVGSVGHRIEWLGLGGRYFATVRRAMRVGSMV